MLTFPLVAIDCMLEFLRWGIPIIMRTDGRISRPHQAPTSFIVSDD